MSTADVDFKFWAITIPKDSERALKMENNNSVYHVSNATLGNKVKDGRTTVYFKVNGMKSPICNLVNNTLENASLDLIVSRSMNASFVTDGVNSVTVSGYVQPLVEEDSDSDQLKTVMGIPITNEVHDNLVEVKASESKEEAPEVEASVVKPVVTKPVAPALEEEKKESKKRKLDEIEETETAKPSQEKRKKKKKKKKKTHKSNDVQAVAPAKAEKAMEVEEVKEEPAKVEEKEPVKEVQSKTQVEAKEESKEAAPKKKSKKSKKMIDAGKGVKYRVLKRGKAGVSPAKKGDSITLRYVGCLKDGTKFDTNLKDGLTFKIGGDEVIPGIELGVMGMCQNEKRKIIIPSEQGYGADGASEGAIPPNAELHFTVQRVQ